MKILRLICLLAACAVFLASGALLLNDYLSDEKDRRALEGLSKMVVREADRLQSEAKAAEHTAAPSVSVQVIKRGGETDGGDVVALAEAVQDYMERALAPEDAVTEIITLEIGTDDDGDARVRVSVGGAESALSKTVEEELERAVRARAALEPSLAEINDVVDLGVRVEPKRVLPEYAELKRLNPDIAGWIEIEGTPIDYPVMHTPEDPEFYLRANFEKEYSYGGLPFIDARCDAKKPTESVLIYGHNMKNGTMFGKLSNYESKRFYNEHPLIRFDLINERRTYEVFGAFRSKQHDDGEDGFRYYDYLNLSNMAVYEEFVREIKRRSFYDTGIEPAWGEQILMLSTCSYHTSDGTFVVAARRIE